MRTLLIKAVIITDGENYIIHGVHSNPSKPGDETPAALFKAMTPLWNMDPAVEIAHYVEVPVQLPELEDRVTDENPVTS